MIPNGNYFMLPIMGELEKEGHTMERRTFLKGAGALGLGFFTLVRKAKVWAKGLPSDPGTSTITASGPDVIALPPFEKDSRVTLDQALLGRHTSRSYDPGRSLSKEELSRLLWAAAGVNRPDGKRTVPSAMAKYPVDVLAALPEGVYRYEPKDHKLVRVISDDIREKIPRQNAFKKAAMNVLYVINKDKISGGEIEWADIEIGCMGQSLFLEAAAMGMGSCIYAYVQYDTVTKVLGLKETQILRIAQAVGPVK
jgi:SagB-type dehydrogenase family enzyme